VSVDESWRVYFEGGAGAGGGIDGGGLEQAARFHVETDFIVRTNAEDACVRRSVPVPASGSPVPIGSNWNHGTTYSLHERQQVPSAASAANDDAFAGSDSSTTSIDGCGDSSAPRFVKRACRPLSKPEYLTLIRNRSLHKKKARRELGPTIRMQRTCFVFEEAFWKLDAVSVGYVERKHGGVGHAWPRLSALSGAI
jgi:hypothetical protein